MMTNFNWVFPVLMLVSGLFLMLGTTRYNRNILNGQETSLRKYLIGSTLYGLWVFLISVGGILAVGSIYGSDGWTARETIQIVILGVIGGILAIVGSLWQIFIVSNFRDSLYKSLSRKNKKK
jgi:hypothetical protein